MRILHPEWKLGQEIRVNDRLRDEPRLTSAQREAMLVVASRDEAARCLGLDEKYRPVIQARLSGPRSRTTYALMRNGTPTPVRKPMRETWR